jgi:hypothetical protein
MVYDPAAFERRRRATGAGFTAQSSMNEYARMLAQTRGSRSLGDFERNVTQAIPQFGRTYGKRGLYGQGVKSGIFNRALGEFGANAARSRGRLQEDIAQEQRGFDLRGEQYLSDYDRLMKDIAEEEASAIAQTSASLLNL